LNYLCMDNSVSWVYRSVGHWWQRFTVNQRSWEGGELVRVRSAMGVNPHRDSFGRKGRSLDSHFGRQDGGCGSATINGCGGVTVLDRGNLRTRRGGEGCDNEHGDICMSSGSFYRAGGGGTWAVRERGSTDNDFEI
jgi:hypothetical protein